MDDGGPRYLPGQPSSGRASSPHPPRGAGRLPGGAVPEGPPQTTCQGPRLPRPLLLPGTGWVCTPPALELGHQGRGQVEAGGRRVRSAPGAGRPGSSGPPPAPLATGEEGAPGEPIHSPGIPPPCGSPARARPGRVREEEEVGVRPRRPPPPLRKGPPPLRGCTRVRCSTAPGGRVAASASGSPVGPGSIRNERRALRQEPWRGVLYVPFSEGKEEAGLEVGERRRSTSPPPRRVSTSTTWIPCWSSGVSRPFQRHSGGYRPGRGGGGWRGIATRSLSARGGKGGLEPPPQSGHPPGLSTVTLSPPDAPGPPGPPRRSREGHGGEGILRGDGGSFEGAHITFRPPPTSLQGQLHPALSHAARLSGFACGRSEPPSPPGHSSSGPGQGRAAVGLGPPPPRDPGKELPIAEGTRPPPDPDRRPAPPRDLGIVPPGGPAVMLRGRQGAPDGRPQGGSGRDLWVSKGR